MQKLYIEDNDNKSYIDEDWDTCHFVYADGFLERMAEYDIVGHHQKDGFDYENDRIENVIAVLADGTEIPSVLFFWHTTPYDKDEEVYMKHNPVLNCHGRVVASDDIVSINDAKRRFERKSD